MIHMDDLDHVAALRAAAQALADAVARARAAGLFVRVEFPLDEARLDVWRPKPAKEIETGKYRTGPHIISTGGTPAVADRASSVIYTEGRLVARLDVEPAVRAVEKRKSA